MGHYRTAAGAAAVMALVLAAPATASAGDKHGHGHGHGHGYGQGHHGAIKTVAGGLEGPRQLSEYERHQLVVAESDSGEVSSVHTRTGRVETLLSGLGNAQGVDYRDGLLYVAVGEGPPPDEGAPEGDAAAPAEAPPSQVLLAAEPGGEIIRSWDLLEYEEIHNPDGQQPTMVDEEGVEVPVETLSNPFSVLAQRHRVLVSDAGANAVLSIDPRSGEISTFFVPPVVSPDEVPACAEAPNNPGTTGCDSVPTEITEGPHGLIYVGTLGADVPEAGRVYVLSPEGEIVHVIKGLTGVTGVAVDRWGTVYTSNVLEGAPPMDGPPPAGFDPATVGEMTRIRPWGERSTAQVTMPTGLEIADGKLYASAWSVAGFVLPPESPPAGEVQRVKDRAFMSTP